jgi:hypothetical protein
MDSVKDAPHAKVKDLIATDACFRTRYALTSL